MMQPERTGEYTLYRGTALTWEEYDQLIAVTPSAAECHHVIEEAHAIFRRTQQEAALECHDAIQQASWRFGAHRFSCQHALVDALSRLQPWPDADPAMEAAWERHWSQAHAAPTSRAYSGADAWIA